MLSFLFENEREEQVRCVVGTHTYRSEVICCFVLSHIYNIFSEMNYEFK